MKILDEKAAGPYVTELPNGTKIGADSINVLENDILILKNVLFDLMELRITQKDMKVVIQME